MTVCAVLAVVVQCKVTTGACVRAESVYKGRWWCRRCWEVLWMVPLLCSVLLALLSRLRWCGGLRVSARGACLWRG